MVKTKDNSGTSLVELVVSIAIIGMVLLPILNRFLVAVRTNAESKRVQTQNIIVQDIMEDMKSRKLEDIIIEYNMPGDEYYEAKLSESGIGYDLYLSSDYNIKDIYFLLNRNIDNKYDALITFDARPYHNSHILRDTDYNNYQMPLIREVNSSNHMVAIESYETDMAISVLYANHVTYCSGEEIEALDIEDIKNSMERNIRIDISLATSNILAIVEYIYSSSVIGCGSVTYQLASKNLNLSDDGIEEGIYAFFQTFPSDSITINNSTDYEVDVFAYEQSEDPAMMSVTKPSSINLFSNLPGYEPIKKENAKNRIFNIRVQLFSSRPDFSPDMVYIPGDLYAQLESTKGE